MYFLILFFLIFSSVKAKAEMIGDDLLLNTGSNPTSWVHDQINSVIDKSKSFDRDNQEWLKEHLKLIKKDLVKSNQLLQNTRSCECSLVKQDEKMPSFYVFMSFSLNDQLWLDWSKEIEKIGGIFVIRGIPKQKFTLLAEKIYSLSKKGVLAPIQLYPQLFEFYQIDQVPAIVVTDGVSYDKITGNVTLDYALEILASQGETLQAKKLYQELKDKRQL